MPSLQDLTAKAAIREVALELFAEHGFDAVSVRRIATAAGVSPGLVMHHFGSKAGLRAAVDEHVLTLLNTLIAQVGLDTDEAVVERLEGGDDLAVQLFSGAIPAGSAVLPYLRRMLLTDDEQARGLIEYWFQLILQVLQGLRDRGFLAADCDLEVLSGQLLSMDLGVLLLQGALTETLGFDPLSPDGVSRWATSAYRLLAGLLTSASAPAGSPTGAAPSEHGAPTPDSRPTKTEE